MKKQIHREAEVRQKVHYTWDKNLALYIQCSLFRLAELNFCLCTTCERCLFYGHFFCFLLYYVLLCDCTYLKSLLGAGLHFGCIFSTCVAVIHDSFSALF